MRASLDFHDRPMRWAIAASLALHAVVLCVRFAPAVADKWNEPNHVIMAVLVNAKTKLPPKKAAVIAQVQMDGGGNIDEKGWMPASPLEKGATQVKLKSKPSQGADDKQVEALEREVARMMAQTQKSSWSVPDEPVPSQMKKEISDVEKMALDLAARIDKQASAYASRPKKMFIGLQATQSDSAAWIEAWQRKVEGFGNAFYPEQAQGKIRGTLTLTAGVGKDGRVESIRIDRSSGHKILDDSAKRILKLAGPFEPFDAKMSQKVDILYITRQWRFGPSGLERIEAE